MAYHTFLSKNIISKNIPRNNQYFGDMITLESKKLLKKPLNLKQERIIEFLLSQKGEKKRIKIFSCLNFF